MDLKLLGNIDIYLLDQVMRGRITPGARVLDAGCGAGRNLAYFMRAGHEVCGVDESADAIASARQLAATIDCARAEFRVAPVESLPFEDDSFDVVVCNAVLHFSRDRVHFDAMVDQLTRVLKHGGLCFCRLASNIGIENTVRPLDGATIPGWYHLPDGSDRFLVDLGFLEATTQRIGAVLRDPIKTVNVQGMRCMTNWVWSLG